MSLYHIKKYTLCWALLAALPAAAYDRFEEDPINYGEATATNSVSRLQDAIDDGSVKLKYDPETGYLKSVLHYLEIPQESQVLVFSKTSFQNRYISPTRPRAIYFNDSTYLGTVQNGDVLEISTTDPDLGTVFYALPQLKKDKPQLVRQSDNCLQCHASSLTRGVPGHLVRSVFPDKEGFPILKAGSHLTSQDSPLEERWGGWYVTGTHGDARHMGNMTATESEYSATIDMEKGANLKTLPSKVNASRYLTPHSDLVALMVLEHQTKMHNLFTRAEFETRLALKDQSVMDKILKRDPDIMTESTRRRISNIGDKVVQHMLFVDEFELEDPIAGTSGFTEQFKKHGPQDDKGRSLRELDLENRLFKYPLSYLIYSDQFDGLPGEVKSYIYQRLYNILIGEEDSMDYAHLTNSKSKAILQILRNTKSDLPDYWSS